MGSTIAWLIRKLAIFGVHVSGVNFCCNSHAEGGYKRHCSSAEFNVMDHNNHPTGETLQSLQPTMPPKSTMLHRTKGRGPTVFTMLIRKLTLNPYGVECLQAASCYSEWFSNAGPRIHLV